MFTLRCTVRLLRRLDSVPSGSPPVPTTRLGDWYANLIHLGRLQLVVAVSEKTFLPVVVAAAPGARLVERVRTSVGNVLHALGIESRAIDMEIAAMSDFTYGKTASKQVLGVMNEYAWLLEAWLKDPEHLLDVSIKLANTPVSPLYKTSVSPDRATVELFQASGPATVLMS